jgi:tetratricopeptide (TPR) repeat protein
LRIRREIGDKTGVTLSLNSIGYFHLVRGNYREALKYSEESLTIRREIGDKRGMASSLNTIGVVHSKRGNYREALKCYEESLRIRREIGDKTGVAMSLSVMGTLHRSLYDLEKVMEYHKEALALTNELEMNRDMVEVLTGIGLDFHFSGDDENALDNLNRALETVEEFGLIDVEMMVLNALSEVWLSKFKKHSRIRSHSSAKGKLNSEKFMNRAMVYCERLLKKAEQEGMKDFIVSGRKIKGEILLTVVRIGQASGSGSSSQIAKKSKEAEKELKDALQIAEEIGASPLQWQIHASLGKVYEETGDKKKASDQFKKAKEIILDLASNIDDEKLKTSFLNAKQIQSLFQ